MVWVKVGSSATLEEDKVSWGEKSGGHNRIYTRKATVFIRPPSFVAVSLSSS